MTGDKTVDQQTDPVCGMEVSGNKATAKADFQGKTYYFCAEGCRKTFEADPQKYLRSRKP